MALSSLSALKIHLGITTSTDDALLVALLSAADQAVKDWTRRDLESTSYTWYLDGSGEMDLLLPQYPVTTLTSVYQDAGGYYGTGTNPFASTTLLTEGSDFVMRRDNTGSASRCESGILRKIGGISGGTGGEYGWYPSYGEGVGRRRGLAGRKVAVWPKGSGNIKVVAVAGYTTVPADIIQAVHAYAGYFWQATKIQRAGGVSSTGVEDFNVSYLSAKELLGQNGIPPDVELLLKRYRKVIF